MKQSVKNKAMSNGKKEIKRMLKDIQERAIKNLEKALNSGTIDEDSEFLEPNSLLAMTVIEDAATYYKIRTLDYRKEADNIMRFI